MGTLANANTETNFGDGMLQWGRAGAVQDAMARIKQSPNEGTVSSQNAAILPKFDRNPYYLLLNFMKVVLGDDENAWSYFSGNLNAFTDQLGSDGAAALRQTAKAIWDKHSILARQSAPTPTKTTTPKKEKAKIQTPALDQAVDLVDGLSNMPLPEAVKSSLKTVKSALELARAAKQEESSNAVYMRHIADLSSAMFETIAEVVKAAGQNAELAAKAAGQLGKIAKLLGGIGKVLTIVTAIQKIVYGKDQGERIDAVIDLITTFGGTVGAAVGISLNTFKWCWNTIGVPIKNATEEVGLRAVFDKKSPEALKAEFDQLAATEPKKSAWAVSRMRYKIFKPVSSPFAPNWNTRDAWERFLKQDGSDNIDIRVADAFKKGYTPGSDPVLDMLVEEAKDKFRRKAHAFIDSVVGEAKRWN